MKTYRKAIASVAVLGAALAGGAVGAASLAGSAGAQDAATTTVVVDSAAPATATDPAPDPSTDPAPDRGPGPGHHDPSLGGHTANGITETLLTGDDASAATAAALASEPGATVERVETDAEGAAYEAHIVKADGTHAIVLMDDSFTVTSVEAGPGPR